MEKKELGVRKGAWTKEEDILLTKCIQQFGEGRWHLVPPRAGLNRCRKSCRMRWLNYLKPNIKRGNFEEDEVDLLKRMHKLLGNRWSLIAGRLPGRTANDVKNFWNSHICKKSTSKMAIEASRNVVIKPRPRNLSMSRSAATTNDDGNVNNNTDIASSSSSSQLMVGEEKDESNIDEWWRKCLQMSENGEIEDEMLTISSPVEDDFINDIFGDLAVGLDI